MKYEVEWEDDARSEVAAEFSAGKDKIGIIDALYQIGLALESDPIGNGEPLSEGMHYVDRVPLRAIYSIDGERRRVVVGRVRRIA